jgi:tetratricopeptide (TPR) repeat protein
MAKVEHKYYLSLFHVYLQMGLLAEAEQLISLLAEDVQSSSTALLSLAKEDYPNAIAEYTSWLQAHPPNLLISSNLSIAYLLTANVQSAISTLEPVLHNSSLPRHAILPHAIYNLSTMYEIRDDKSRAKKEQLMETVVSLHADIAGKSHYKLDTLR